MKAIVLGLLVASAPVQAADQFNLWCRGTLTSEDLYRKETKPYDYTYRFDLKAGKYCDGECKSPREIKRIDPTQLVLEDEEVDTLRNREYKKFVINRETGAHRSFYSSGEGASILLMKWEGNCVPLPFSGFPEPKTKF